METGELRKLREQYNSSFALTECVVGKNQDEP
ncbi:hypothetical protein PS861_01473 [Pseudomonas fluorescens]|nr:hypothetical protein PS861_01473 [Pseudomonas fluorescens]